MSGECARLVVPFTARSRGTIALGCHRSQGSSHTDQPSLKLSQEGLCGPAPQLCVGSRGRQVAVPQKVPHKEIFPRVSMPC